LDKKPAVEIFWDEANQQVNVKVDPEQIRNWTFAKMVCAEAGTCCDKAEKIALMRQAQAQHAQPKIQPAPAGLIVH